MKRFYLNGAYFEILETDFELLIKTFIIPDISRNMGLGLNVLTNFINNSSKKIKVEISDVFGSDISRLKKFYIKCGILEENLIF